MRLAMISVCISSFGCVKELSKSAIEAEVRAHDGETVNNVWYIGSSDGLDYFLHNTTLHSETLAVKEGEMRLTERFPLTREKTRWVLVRGEGDIMFRSERIGSLQDAERITGSNSPLRKAILDAAENKEPE